MSFEDIVTKKDLAGLEDRIVGMLSNKIRTVFIPEVCGTDLAREILGGKSGPVSDNYLIDTRKKNPGIAKQIGTKWVYNVKALVALLPPDPAEKK